MHRLLLIRRLLIHIRKERKWWLTLSFVYLMVLIVLAGTDDDEGHSLPSIYPLF